VRLGAPAERRHQPTAVPGAARQHNVTRLDAAHLFRLLLESAPAGAVLHSVAEEGVPVRDIAGVIARRLRLPVRPISTDEADGYFGWLVHIVEVDHPASSALTREQLGWQPVQPGLIADLNQGHYFGD
jgi:nucleoside-diphosphate-sugar epimerase